MAEVSDESSAKAPMRHRRPNLSLLLSSFLPAETWSDATLLAALLVTGYRKCLRSRPPPSLRSGP